MKLRGRITLKAKMLILVIEILILSGYGLVAGTHNMDAVGESVVRTDDCLCAAESVKHQ